METWSVRDIMLSLTDVPTVREEATLLEAVCALDRAQRRRREGASRYRAVLVVNARGQVVGKLGHLAFLRAIEPGFESPADRDTLDRAGVDPDLLESLSGHRRFWHGELEECCRRSAHVTVREVMHPLAESVDADTPLIQAVSTLVRLQVLSIPVREAGQVVGLLRLADLYDLIAHLITREGCDGQPSEPE
jgi:CBS domain-containing protein